MEELDICQLPGDRRLAVINFSWHTDFDDARTVVSWSQELRGQLRRPSIGQLIMGLLKKADGRRFPDEIWCPSTTTDAFPRRYRLGGNVRQRTGSAAIRTLIGLSCMR